RLTSKRIGINTKRAGHRRGFSTTYQAKKSPVTASNATRSITRDTEIDRRGLFISKTPLVVFTINVSTFVAFSGAGPGTGEGGGWGGRGGGGRGGRRRWRSSL